MKVKQRDGIEVEVNDMWDFLTHFMTNYSHDDRVMLSDRFARFINDEISDPQDIIDYGFEDMTKEKARQEEINLNYECLIEALDNYNKENSKPSDKHTLKVAFGTELCDALDNEENVDLDTMCGSVNEYSFDTKEERSAFLFGINEFDGYLDYYVMEGGEA